MRTEFFIESLKNDFFAKWSRLSNPYYTLEDAKQAVQDCLNRLKENGEYNFKHFGVRVLQYRIVQVNTISEETTISHYNVDQDFNTNSLRKKSLQEAKENELHYLKQVLKYFKHLEHLYKNGATKDETHAFSIEISINNTQKQINTLEKEMQLL
jgi:hypothetical protein